MLFEIITNTPIWVFILFFFLVLLGLSQTRDRKVSLNKVMILPIVMLLLSFVGVLSAFGINFNSLLAYLSGLLFGILLNIKLNFPRNSTYSEAEKLFFIKGSFVPFILIMAIFFTKYFVGVVSAKDLPFIYSIYFSLIISLLYGFFSGIFFGRIFVLRKILK